MTLEIQILAWNNKAQQFEGVKLVNGITTLTFICHESLSCANGSDGPNRTTRRVHEWQT